jgi:hypothetical protein
MRALALELRSRDHEDAAFQLRHPRQASRHVDRNYPSLWRKEAAEEGRERKPRPERKGGSSAMASRREAGAAWTHIAAALRSSGDAADRASAAAIEQWMEGRPVARELEKSPPIRSPNVERTR